MTRTKKELIERINRLTGVDRTDELNELPKYKLCLIIANLKEQEELDDYEDLTSRIGVSVKF